MIKLKLNITGSNPPFEYRLVGTDVWQDEPVFEVPRLDGAGGYAVEVRDSTGCTKTFEIYEETIGLELIGGYVTEQLEVVASYGSNIPIQARIWWGIGGGYPYDPDDFEGLTDWTEEIDVVHEIPFPISFVGSLHFFQAIGRSRLGQEYVNSIRGIYYVPENVEIELSSLIPYSEVLKFEVDSIEAKVSNLSVAIQTSLPISKVGLTTHSEVHSLNIDHSLSNHVDNGLSSNVTIQT